MARASLVRLCDGFLSNVQGTTYETQAEPFAEPPFVGPPDRDWAAFKVLSEDGATFEWRTGTERVREVLTQVAVGRMTRQQAVGSALVRRYMDRLEWALAEETPEHLSDPEDVAAWVLRQALERIDELGEVCNDFAPFHFYSFDNDDYFHDAATVLPLPDWAQYHRVHTGGMGSDYDSALIVLAPGHTLSEYGAWLERQVRP